MRRRGLEAFVLRVIRSARQQRHPDRVFESGVPRQQVTRSKYSSRLSSTTSPEGLPCLMARACGSSTRPTTRGAEVSRILCRRRARTTSTSRASRYSHRVAQGESRRLSSLVVMLHSFAGSSHHVTASGAKFQSCSRRVVCGVSWSRESAAQAGSSTDPGPRGTRASPSRGKGRRTSPPA